MKFVILTLALFTLGTTQAASSIHTNYLLDIAPPVAEKDMVMSKEAHTSLNQVQFDIVVLNESSNVIYGLKREYADGRFETAVYCKATPSLEGEDPFVSHEIQDKNVPEEDFTYVLVRIHTDTRAFKVIGRWNYCHDLKEICADVMYAAN